MPDTPRARFGALLRELRTAHRPRLIQSDIGRIMHVTADAVATWERGRSLPPDEHAVTVLDKRLGADGALLAAWRDAQADSAADRAAVGSGAGVSAATVIATAARDAAQFGAWAEQQSTGAVAITTLMVRARTLAERALTAPPAEVLGPASDLNRELFALLHGHHKPAHARDLYTVAGATCVLLAFLESDLGALGAAQVHAATADVCAQHADRDELRAWVASAQAKNLFWTGDYAASAHLAHGGLALDPHGTAAVMLACQEADAYAKLGAHEPAAAALDRAEREADHIQGTDLIGGVLSCPPARRGGYVATASTLAGRHDRALAATEWALEEGIAMGERFAFGSVAQLHVTRAMAHVGAGDLDGAAAALRPVLELPPRRRLATITGRLRALSADLGRPGTRSSTVVAPLREEIAAYCAGGVQRAITRGQADA